MKIGIDDEINIGDMLYDPLSEANVQVVDIGSYGWIKVEFVDSKQCGWAHILDFEYLDN